MLRPSKKYLAAACALGLCAAWPAAAQLTGLSEKIDVAEQQLKADIGSCKPIDVQAYESLVSEANRNYKIASEVSLKSSAPTDLEKLHADFNRAVVLRDKAKAAAQMACELAHGGSGTKPIEVETKVEPPKLSTATPAGNYKPSTPTIENKGPDYVFMFRAALERYRDAKKRCDGPGMMAARAEMDAAQGAAREILAGENALGGKSELLKQMAEQRQAAEDGTVSMCPSLTPALAHMLSEPPRVSSEPKTDEPSKAFTPVVANSKTRVPTYADPALAARAYALCSGPGLGDFAKLPAVPPAAVIPGSPGAEAAAAYGYGPSVEGTGSAADRSDEPRFHVGLQYEFAGRPLCPNYQETQVPQPELPNKEVFGRVDPGIIDPDYSPPLQIDLTPQETQEPKDPK